MDYSQHFSTKQTPQTQKVPGKNQVKNSAGGYVFELDKWSRLDRFLILGSEKGTYYVNENFLTVENAESAVNCIRENGEKVVQRVTEISVSGRAPKNDPAIFVLALATAFGDAKTKSSAYNAISSVCRTGTHLFQFCEAVSNLRGWSRGLRSGVAKFYLNRNLNSLQMQVIKYRNRNGWSHRDVLRLSHPKTNSPAVNAVFSYVTKRDAGQAYEVHPELSLIKAFEQAQKESVPGAIKLIKDNNLPWEAVPTEMHKHKEVWEALLPGMGVIALTRNLARMSSLGVLEADQGNLNNNNRFVVDKLANQEELKASKIHPLQVLLALSTYRHGAGVKGKLSWRPVKEIVNALDGAFYKTFTNVEPTGKKFLLAVDVSGSMDSAVIAGTHLTARTAAAAMALVTANTEPNVAIVGFSSVPRRSWNDPSGDLLVPLDIAKGDRLQEVVEKMRHVPMGQTDCALPVLYAMQKNLMIDVFVIYTDNESYAGKIHVYQALEEYRRKVNPSAKMVVMAMAANKFSVADPNDNQSLDVVGFDSNVPEVISSFVKS